MSVFPGTRHFVSFLHPPSGAARRLPAASVLSPPGGHRLSGKTDNTTLRRAAFYSARQKNTPFPHRRFRVANLPAARVYKNYKQTKNDYLCEKIKHVC